MNDCMVDVQNVTIRFNMASERIDNLKEYFVKLAKRELMFKEFLALKDVNLKVMRGESWGLIGTNGSGKSTLLKAICGIFKPYRGTVKTYGTIAPLIELGAGFDGDLTARENIYLNGAVLGHSKKFMQEHFDEIVDFAELWDFLDMPIKNYSSGMAARLGFAIATVVRPDILICDEVLAVGDYAFQQKCEDRLNEMKAAGTTLLYVSHSIKSVMQVCDHAIWLNKGHVMGVGDVKEISRLYLDSLNPTKELIAEEMNNHSKLTDDSSRALSVFCSDAAKREGTGAVRFTSIEILGENGIPKTHFKPEEKISLRFQYASTQKGFPASFAFSIGSKDHGCIYRTSTKLEYTEMIKLNNSGMVTCALDYLPITQGTYYLDARIWGENEILYDSLTEFIPLEIVSDNKGKGLIHIPHRWNLFPQSSFFQKEIRCGFEVDEKRKRIWAIELDMANKLLTACRENGLKIFADAGTMLGAVRHKGYIPWDDDMDFAMFREDYDKLCEVAPRYFDEPYFFQTVYTDKKYIHGHAQIRNSYTTGILPGEENREYNQGIFIDVFVLESVTPDREELERQKYICDILKQYIRTEEYGGEFAWPENFDTLQELGERPSVKACWEYIDEMFRKVSLKEVDKVAPLNFIFDVESRIRSKHIYDDVLLMDFEYLQVPVPAGYDEYLSNRYGDYMLPQNVANTHGTVIFDVDKPYTTYLEEYYTRSGTLTEEEKTAVYGD